MLLGILGLKIARFSLLRTRLRSLVLVLIYYGSAVSVIVFLFVRLRILVVSLAVQSRDMEFQPFGSCRCQIRAVRSQG